jgi:hypothetical protein
MIFQSLTSQDIVTARSFLNQLIDILQQDISNASNRKKYQVFVTGGVGPGVTSSLFQTVYDQDHTYVSSNPIFDMTVGLFGDKDLNLTVSSTNPTLDSNGKLLFPSQSLMMREKIDIYRQFAQQLLGDASYPFYLPWDSTNAINRIDIAFFLSFKSLFSRDGIQRDTFAMRFSKSAYIVTGSTEENIHRSPGTGSMLTYVDMGSSTSQGTMFGGNVGAIYQNGITGSAGIVGTLFYDRGVAVFDLAKICSSSQAISGSISAMNSSNYVSPWDNDTDYDGPGNTSMGNNLLGPMGSYAAEPFIPNFITSASIDNILDHLSLRFSENPETGITFQNITNVNSTLFFCRARPEDFNYSSNPTYVDSNQQITVIEQGQENTQQSFTFITSVGLYDKDGTLLAVAKLSRPVEKNSQRDLTLRVRLDF